MLPKLVKIVGIATLIGSFGIWVYAFSGAADRDPPDMLDDSRWSEAAEPICAAALADVASLPNAAIAKSAEERSEQILQANDRFDLMVDDLAALPATSDRDTQITKAWLADLEVLLNDRRRYAAAILDDPAAPFTITDTGVRERLQRRITRFATTNNMPSCVAPSDV